MSRPPVYHRPISSQHASRPLVASSSGGHGPTALGHFYTTGAGQFHSFGNNGVHGVGSFGGQQQQQQPKQARAGSAAIGRESPYAPHVSARNNGANAQQLGRTMPAGAMNGLHSAEPSNSNGTHIQTHHFAPPPAHLSQTQQHSHNGAPPPWQHFRGPVAAVHRGGNVRGVPAPVRPQSSFASLRPQQQQPAQNGQAYNIITGLGSNSMPVSPARGGWGMEEPQRRGSGSAAAPLVLESPGGHARVYPQFPHQPSPHHSSNGHHESAAAPSNGRPIARVGSAVQQRSQSVDRNARSARNVKGPQGSFDPNRFSHAQTLSASQMVLDSARNTAELHGAQAYNGVASTRNGFNNTQSLSSSQRLSTTQQQQQQQQPPRSLSATQTLSTSRPGTSAFGSTTTARPGTSSSSTGPSSFAQTTSRPGTSSSDDGASFIEVGVAEDPNPRFRPTMEDAHVVKLGDWVEEEPLTNRSSGGGGTMRFGATARRANSMDFAATRRLHPSGPITHPSSGAKGRDAKSGYFAIYDGHGGREAVEYIERNLHRQLAKQLKSGAPPQAALEAAFLRTDEDMQATRAYQDSGSTVASALIRPSVERQGQRDLFVANAGDARAVLAVAGPSSSPSPLKAMRLSMDHTPNVPSEAERVRRAGGAVFRGRVDGQLAVCVAPSTELRLMGRCDPVTRQIQAVANAPRVVRADAVTQWDVLYGEDGQPAVVAEVPINSATTPGMLPEVLFDITQEGAMSYSVTGAHKLWLEWRFNPTIINHVQGNTVYREISYYTPTLHVQTISVILAATEQSDPNAEVGEPPVCCNYRCWRAGEKECGTRLADTYWPPHQETYHFNTEAQAQEAANAWSARQAKIYVDSNGQRGFAKLNRHGAYAGPLVVHHKADRKSFLVEWCVDKIMRRRGFSYSAHPRGALPSFVEIETADAYLVEKLLALPRTDYLMKGDRFRMTAQLLSERLPQLQGSGKAPFGVIGPSSPVVVADVTAQWVLHGAFTMGLKGLARLKAVLAACAALGAGMSAEQKAARFGLDELVVCLTPALVFDAAVASKWRAPQATDVIGGIVFLPNSLCRTDMTQKKNGVTTTATFNHLTSLMQALPVGVRGRVLVQDAVPMVSSTGTMNVAETCWDPVSRETLNFIAMTRVPWIVAASTDVQALFMRLCTQFGASITTPVGVEIRTMRHGDHTFEMYSVPHPCIVYTLADMYGAIVTATQRSASPPPPVLWNGAVPASLGNAGRVHPLASLKLITGCSAVAAKRRHWIGISVDTVQHLFQLRDGTITSNSRAIGDHSLKRSGVSAQPTQQHVPLTKDHKFLIVACDGLWDVMTDSEAVNLVAGMKDASKMADKLVKTAMQRGTTDNVSAMCIRLQQDDGARK